MSCPDRPLVPINTGSGLQALSTTPRAGIGLAKGRFEAWAHVLDSFEPRPHPVPIQEGWGYCFHGPEAEAKPAARHFGQPPPIRDGGIRQATQRVLARGRKNVRARRDPPSRAASRLANARRALDGFRDRLVRRRNPEPALRDPKRSQDRRGRRSNGARFALISEQPAAGPYLSTCPGAVGWVELMTHDTDRAADFCRTVFGWEAPAGDAGPVVNPTLSRAGAEAAGMIADEAQRP